MKIGQLLFFICVFANNVNAQTNKLKEPELTREQKWLLEKTASFYKESGVDASSKAFLVNFKKVLTNDVLCKPTSSASTTLVLEGDRLSSETAILNWNVTNEEGGESYIIERRYDNPFGKFDSVGIIKGASAKAVAGSYHFVDNNNYNGKTWYRIRMNGNSDDKKIVCIDGYNNKVRVFPNPSSSSSVLVQLNKFKTDDNTNLVVLDARGRIIYTQNRVFMNDKIMKLQNLQLTPGTYYVKVANKLNSGGAAFIIQ